MKIFVNQLLKYIIYIFLNLISLVRLRVLDQCGYLFSIQMFRLTKKDLLDKNWESGPVNNEFFYLCKNIQGNTYVYNISKLSLDIYFIICILQEKTDKILNLLIEVAYENKFKSIRTKFKSLTESDCIQLWSDQFHHNISNFEDNLGGFELKNLKKLFKHIYENKESIFVVI